MHGYSSSYLYSMDRNAHMHIHVCMSIHAYTYVALPKRLSVVSYNGSSPKDVTEHSSRVNAAAAQLLQFRKAAVVLIFGSGRY